MRIGAREGAVAGCGGSSGSTASGGASGGNVTLKLVAADYGTGPSNASQKYWEGIARAFHAANPSISVAVTTIALERGQLNGVFAQGRFTQSDYVSFTESRAAKLDALARFERVATPQRVGALRAAQRTPEATFAARYEERALRGAAGCELQRQQR